MVVTTYSISSHCHLIQSFKNLKDIDEGWCGNLKHVFDLQGCDTYGKILQKLEILELIGLGKLKGIIICNNEENDDIRASPMHQPFD